MAFSLPVYMVVRPRATLAIWHYFRRRQGFGVFKTVCHVWKNHFGFGQVVIDRFAAYAGKKFKIEVEGRNLYREIESSGRGFMMISSHIGNHEMAGYDLRSKARLNVLAYGGEVEEVRSGRARLLAENNIRMVPITDGISHIFVLKEALENDEVVDIHGDRLFGSPKAFECSVLGAPADLPQGPFVLACSVSGEPELVDGASVAAGVLPVIAVFCVKVGYKHFKIYIERLDAPSAAGDFPASGKGPAGVPQGEPALRSAQHGQSALSIEGRSPQTLCVGIASEDPLTPNGQPVPPASGKGPVRVPQGEPDSGIALPNGQPTSPASGLSARQRAQLLAQRYADAVSGILRQYPDQWYNFFEFWK